MKKILKIVREVAVDIAKFRLPVTAGALVATAASYLSPVIGVDIGGATTARVTAALVLLGVVAETVKRYVVV